MKSTGTRRSVISAIVLALVSVLAIAGAADAKKKHHKSSKPKPVTLVSKQAASIPAGTKATFDSVSGNELTPEIDGKAQSTIKVAKKDNFPIKSAQVAAIVKPSSPAAYTIGVSLALTSPSGATQFLNTPFFSPPDTTPGSNDPGSPVGVGYGTGTNCNGSAMKFTDNSKRDPASENPNPAFDDPGFADFTSFPPYTSPVSQDLNSKFSGLNSKGTWTLTAFNPTRFGPLDPTHSNATDTSSLVCWSLTLKPQKLPKGQSA